MTKEQTANQPTETQQFGLNVLLANLRNGIKGRHQRILRPETGLACVMILSLLFPLAVLAPPLDMNGMSRAANQLSRKVMRGQDLPTELLRKLQTRSTLS